MTSTANDAGDVIVGGTGVDTISVAAGSSIVFSTTDANISQVENVTLGSGSGVTLTGQAEGFIITGGGSAGGTIVGGDGADSITGGIGGDVITGGIGADTIDGGIGRDTVSYADVASSTSHELSNIVGMAINLSGASVAEGDIDLVLDSVSGLAAAANVLGLTGSTALADGTAQYAIVGAKGDNYFVDTLTNLEAVVGSNLNDYIVLGSGGMSADGGNGNDAIFGGNGADNISGGAGNDAIIIADDADHATGEVITGGAGTDVIRFISTEAGTLNLTSGVTGVEEVRILDNAQGSTFAGTTAENVNANALTAGISIFGNDGANTLTGSAFADTFNGNAGADTIIAGDGDDTINVSTDDDDVIDGGDGTDTVVFTAVVASADFVDADLQNVENITVTGANAVDLSVQTEAFTITAIDGAAHNVTSGAGSDTITFGAGNDTVVAGAGDDTVNGGAGDDEITGGTGNDNLTGGVGADDFNFVDNNGLDTITDFLANTDDLDFGGITGITSGNVSALIAADAAAAASADATTHVFENGADGAGDSRITDFTSMSDVASFLMSNFTGVDDTHAYVALINNVATGTAYAYFVDVNLVTTAEDTIEAGDVSLIGVITEQNGGLIGVADVV